MSPMLGALMIGLMLLLPISSLIARRLPLGSVLRMAILWIAIFALATTAVLVWRSLTQVDTEEPAPFVKDVAATTWPRMKPPIGALARPGYPEPKLT